MTLKENRMTLTPRNIEDRFEEAAWTLRRQPDKDRPRGYRSAWPQVVHEAKHAYGYTEVAPMRVIPSAAAITRMEECLDWLRLIDPEDARIVWLRAEGARWRQVCIRAGVVRSTAWRRWAAALLTIAKKLNMQAKSTRKLKAPNPPAATPGTIPRESAAKLEDEVQNALNFGRDTSSGSGA
ncbi:hypothetical protein GALL_508970 [mine drainage metagenome]|uniref:DUF6362 domain-containing protein n=1 Tax=mine drainage metagenome TaxID=410659 RepID=A0A1J5PJ10_9ZZZZ